MNTCHVPEQKCIPPEAPKKNFYHSLWILRYDLLPDALKPLLMNYATLFGVLAFLDNPRLTHEVDDDQLLLR